MTSNERYEKFLEMMRLIIRSKDLINCYENIPRTYGSPDILYQGECHTIQAIGDDPEISITEIAKQMNKTKSASSQLIDRLVRKGFVLKSPSPHNNRSCVLSLTPLGEQVYQFHKKFDSESYHSILESLSQFSLEDLETFVQIQTAINQKLEENTHL